MAINAAKWKALPQYQKDLWRKRETAQMGQIASETKYRANTYWQINQAKAERLAEGRTAFEAGQTTEELERSEAINIASKEASQQRAEEFRAKDEERKMRENVQLTTPTPEPEEDKTEDIIRLGGAREATTDTYERSLLDKILYGKLGSTLASDAGTGESKGAGFEDDVIRLGGTSEALPGETEFQAERRISDQQARARELKYREEDQKFFEDIEIKKRLREVEQRQEDEAFYRELRRKQYERETQERAEEQEDWFEIAREREERKQKEREEDAIYWDKIARQNREREIQYRKEDDEYWDNLRKRREDDDEPSPSVPGTAPAPTQPSGTSRTFMPGSSLGFGLLKTSGGFTDEEEEKKKKKKKK